MCLQVWTELCSSGVVKITTVYIEMFNTLPKLRPCWQFCSKRSCKQLQTYLIIMSPKKSKGKHFLDKMTVCTACDKEHTTMIIRKDKHPHLQGKPIGSTTDDVMRWWLSTSPGPRWLRCPEYDWEWRGWCCDVSSGPAVCPEASCPAAPCLWPACNTNEKFVHLVLVASLKHQREIGYLVLVASLKKQREIGSSGSGCQSKKQQQ